MNQDTREKFSIILGIHGNYFNPTANGYESSVSVIKNGTIISAISEERLSRKKVDGCFPYLALRENLNVCGLTIADIDVVALASLHPTDDMARYFRSVISTFFDTGVFLRKKFNLFGWGWIYNSIKTPKEFFFEYEGKKIPIRFIDHHLSHAAGAYYCSPFDEALVVTLDGGGNGLDGSVYFGNGTTLNKIFEVPHFQSPGTMYSAITNDLGFKRHRHEGKITGLAAYGIPDIKKMRLKSLIKYSQTKHRFVSKRIAKQHSNINARSDYFFPLLEKFSKENLSATVQKIFEDETLAFIRDAYHEGKKKGLVSKNICVAGGCFANVKLNQRILEMGLFQNIFVFPAMGDEGLSAGAGLMVYYQNTVTDNKKNSILQDVYLGGKFTEQQIESALKEFSLKYQRYDDIETETGKLLAEGKIVGRFNGAMEYGPRALGNRSIIAAPFDASINDWLNKKLKRTEFMPFAPSMLFEHVDEFLEGYSSLHKTADFMTITYSIKPGMKDKICAAVHVDNTARPQVVRKEINPSYHKIISVFNSLTGCPVVLNTSFNIHEEPIVYTPQDAIRGFLDAQLDYLSIGNFLASYFENKK